MSIRLFHIDARRLNDRILELAQIGRLGETGVRRLALSPEYREGVELVRAWMEEAGLTTRVDGFGNLIGRLEGADPDAPLLMIGSHIDSQPAGGRYDGTVGVLGGLEVLQTLREAAVRPQRSVEVVSFCDEEGCRFNQGLFGSRGILGQVAPEELDRKDEQGITRREALRRFGSDLDQLQESVYPKGSVGTIWNSTSSRDRCWSPRVIPWASLLASPVPCG